MEILYQDRAETSSEYTHHAHPRLNHSACPFRSLSIGRNILSRYLEADVRRNGRNEARREVTLPWFQEEGSQPSQLGGYRIILFLITFLEIFVQPNFGQNFEWTRQIHGTANPGAQEATTLLTVFRFVSACLHRASTQHLE